MYSRFVTSLVQRSGQNKHISQLLLIAVGFSFASILPTPLLGLLTLSATTSDQSLTADTRVDLLASSDHQVSLSSDLVAISFP